MADEKEWTIMVYMAGDNNLSEYMAHALGDIGDVGYGLRRPSENNVNLMAFIDSSSLTTPSHYIDFSKGKAEKGAKPAQFSELSIRTAGSRTQQAGYAGDACNYRRQ